MRHLPPTTALRPAARRREGWKLSRDAALDPVGGETPENTLENAWRSIRREVGRGA